MIEVAHKPAERADAELEKIVRRTEGFRTTETEGKLLRLLTGDGGALVFRTSPEAPVRCALEISKGLKKHPELRVRGNSQRCGQRNYGSERTGEHRGRRHQHLTAHHALR
jgi:hypothetical protein